MKPSGYPGDQVLEQRLRVGVDAIVCAGAVLDDILPCLVGVFVVFVVVEGSENGDLLQAFDGVSLVSSVFEGAGRLLCEEEASAENHDDDCNNLFHFFVFL